MLEFLIKNIFVVVVGPQRQYGKDSLSKGMKYGPGIICNCKKFVRATVDFEKRKSLYNPATSTFW
jgi:hypothetical protein